MPVVDLTMLRYKEMQHLLNDMKHELLKERAQKAGVREIAKPLKRDLLAEIPVETGTLRSSIGYKVMTKKFKSYAGIPVEDFAMEVGATRKVLDKHMKKPRKRLQVYLLRFLNDGVSAHKITRRKSIYTNKFKRGGLHEKGKNFGREVNHTGFAGRNISGRINARHKDKMDNYFVQGAANYLQKMGIRGVMD